MQSMPLDILLFTKMPKSTDLDVQESESSSLWSKEYWPFHKAFCTRNEFADIVEKDDPKFAKWMRKHGKLATLKDNEVDRLERARSAVSGPGVDEVMHKMFNRVHPKPQSPSYSAEEIKRVKTTPQRPTNVFRNRIFW